MVFSFFYATIFSLKARRGWKTILYMNSSRPPNTKYMLFIPHLTPDINVSFCGSVLFKIELFDLFHPIKNECTWGKATLFLFTKFIFFGEVDIPHRIQQIIKFRTPAKCGKYRAFEALTSSWYTPEFSLISLVS